nr:hypothetical protein [Zobellia laminariae]
MLLISYKLAFEKTFNSRSLYLQQASMVKSIKNTPQQLSLLNQKETYYDSILGKMNLSDTSFQNNLLKMLNREARTNSIKVIDFNQPHIYSNDSNIEKTFSFNLRGSYLGILKTVYNIEQKAHFGNIIHVHFEKKNNYRTRKSYLETYVLIRQLK